MEQSVVVKVWWLTKFNVSISELRLMFNLMDRVPDGITPMLHDLETHVVNQGLADMIAAADIITSVCTGLLV